MIEALRGFYRRHLKQYWWGRVASLVFYRASIAIFQFWVVFEEAVSRLLFLWKHRWSDAPQRYRIRAKGNSECNELAARIFIHHAEAVTLPGPKIWRGGVSTPTPGPEFVHAYIWPDVQLFETSNASVAGASDFVFVGSNAFNHPMFDPKIHTTSEELHLRGIMGSNCKYYYRVKSHVPDVGLTEAIALVGSCAANYAHWLTEMLPRLLLADLAPRCRTLPVLVDAGLHRNMIASIAALAPSHTELVMLEAGQLASADRLFHLIAPGYVPFDYRVSAFGRRPKIALRNSDAARFSPFALRLLRKRVEALFPEPAKPHRRLLLRRNSAARSMINHDEIEAALVSDGFEVIEPETLSFLDQVRTFREASMIVAQTGAGLANLLFVPAGCQAIVAIARSPYSNYSYYSNLAHLVGVELCYVEGSPVGQAAWHPAHSDFSIGPEEIVAAVRGWREAR